MALILPKDIAASQSELFTILVHPGEGRLYFTKPSLEEMKQIYLRDVPYTPALPSFLPEDITVAQIESRFLRVDFTTPQVEEWIYFNIPYIVFAVSTGMPLSSTLHSFIYEGVLPVVNKNRLAFLHLAVFCQENKLKIGSSIKQKFNLLANQSSDYAISNPPLVKIEDFDLVRRTLFPFNVHQIAVLKSLQTKKFIKDLTQDEKSSLGFPLSIFEKAKDEIPFLLNFGILDQVYGDIFITEFGAEAICKFERSQFKFIQ